MFHKDSLTQKTKIKPPKYKGEGKLGVFGTWSPHRLNPIGLSKAEIVNVTDSEIVFEGIDLVEGTPILDIKKFNSGDIPWEEQILPEWLREV